MIGPELSSDEILLPIPGTSGTEEKEENDDDEGVFGVIRTGFWSIVPWIQAPSSPGLSPMLASPFNSRARESGSSSTQGAGGH